MRLRAIYPALLVCCGLAVAGCESDSALFRDNVRVWGAKPLIENDAFQKIDLAILLDPESKGIGGADSAEDKIRNLEQAFDEFNDGIDDETDEDMRKRLRNRVQERILAASNERCGEYKQLIKEIDAEINFWLGSLTTAVAGAGAIFTGTDVVRALSGTASIISGVRSEFNADFFANKTIQVITDGLESRRREIYEEILKNRQSDLTDYPVERAIKDAILYHDNCSLIGGLEQAALSIERAENPGLKQLQNFKKLYTNILQFSAIDVEAILTKRLDLYDVVLDDIDTLSDEQAIELAKNPPVQNGEYEDLIAIIDGQKLREQTGPDARNALAVLATFAEKNADDLMTLSDAIKSALSQ